MRWQKSRRSTNVTDLRGKGGGGKVAGGLGGLVVLLIGLFFGVDVSGLLGGGAAPAASVEQGSQAPPQDTEGDFISAVLGDTEDVWNGLYGQAGAQYPEPGLVLYDGTVRSACGVSGAQTGPFYCPLDSQIYIDLTFFDQLAQMGAPGDFAAAYVVAHEVGHHVQNVEGTLDEVRSAQRRVPTSQSNQLQVAVELQADCYAGIWAHHAERQRDLLEQGDVEEGLRAAASVGDDHLQRQAGQPVQPERFTHGTSEQRATWFRRGLQSGRVADCDTFAGMR